VRAGRAFRPWRSLPLVLLVTVAVSVIPVGVVWRLRSTGTVSSLWLGLLIAGLLSLVISWLIRACWALRPHKSDLLFGELLPLGWLARWRTERQLASGLRLLERVYESGMPPAALTTRRSTRLLERLADALEAQDMYLAGHSRRVARHATMLGRRMGLDRHEVAKLRAAAAIHDVGKLHVPPEILAKPGRLTPEEFDVIKRHSEDGALIVAPLGDAQLTAIVMHHHERIDGKGYPTGLSGEHIPMGARIVAVADTFDAITSARPYRAAACHREAIEELRRCAGTQLDPVAVQTFVRCYAGRRQAVLLGALLALPQRLLGRLDVARASTGSVWGGSLATVAATSFLGAMAVLPPAGTPLGPATADARPTPGAPASPFFPPPTAPDTRRHAWPGHTDRRAASRRRSGRHGHRHDRTAGHHLHHSRTGGMAPRRPGRDDPAFAGAGSRRDGMGRAGRKRTRPTGSGAGSTGTRPAGGSTGSTGTRPADGSTGSTGTRPAGGEGREPEGHDGPGNGSWTPPGQSGQGPPGLSPNGPPGQSGCNPGHGGCGPPGLRGETPPGQSKHHH
jgi:HD-GYP domain-containing protein (c-di-GMP phosphodiesterase class II)